MSTLTPRQSSILALLARRPALPGAEVKRLLAELPATHREAAELVLGAKKPDRASAEALEVAGRLRAWALTEEAAERPGFRVSVSNAAGPAQPAFVDVIVERVPHQGFHPQVFWRGQKADANPFAVFPSEAAALSGGLSAATPRWEREFGSAPQWGHKEKLSR